MFKYELVKENEEMGTVYFKGDLDIEVAEFIEQELIPELGEFQTIHLDLADVSFVDSTGIGLLIHLIDSLKNQYLLKEVLIQNVQEAVQDVFEIIGFREIIGESAFV
ncbi:STAS domain-containing protein [Falsibacillus pallidus]|uniref:Anti-sigma factor antagonist n=1 Tax=Falsibacillus pallidus TaxID=493781 RepID=A0A370G8B1_9BACI|nr:STAS domain-containing protein [Falsibacillus pallidus]RDI40021.1 anti-sigma B factor antagonist/stage II sporulation protein AA (anti-sigma F factor antagonist) [Falsibacillus pallidus]